LALDAGIDQFEAPAPLVIQNSFSSN